MPNQKKTPFLRVVLIGASSLRDFQRGTQISNVRYANSIIISYPLQINTVPPILNRLNIK